MLTATKVPYTFLYQVTTTDEFVAYLTNHETGAAYPAVTARTFEDAEILLLYLWVVARAPQQGANWFNGLERAVLSLDQHPKRFPVAPESIDPDQPVRVMSYGRKPHVYRVFFTVDDAARLVRVVHVRRGARKSPVPDELKGD